MTGKPMLNPIWLQTFVTAAQSKSFTEAGRRLNLTQSTVSDHIVRLETELGRRFFIRDTHSLALTGDGESLLVHARLILEAEARARLHFAGPPLRGRVRLGTSDDMAMGPLPDMLAGFRRLYPEVELDLTLGITDNLYVQLEAGALDLMTGKRRNGDHRGHTLYREALIWFGPEGMAMPQDPLPLVLLPEPSITRAMVLDTLARAGKSWRVTCNSSSHAGCAAAVRAGLGFTVLPKSMTFAGLAPMRDLPPLTQVEYIAVIAPDAGRPAKTLLDILTAARG
ncbi:LysR family transcriptional regulator [Roseiarcaceae bacterium H3SJ34-1]|uniref:LysR family transcriptional regulator n=1 Tax=Terripilifer ovatus TaxID=3032367 RepID=UPI003AB95FDB|nr:LysR family transcriptional regulator [Roseiarcaceae bacterium H3SJ34-1]